MSTQWILAYDEACGKCRAISRTVRQASAGRLEVAPLARADVLEWRRGSLGDHAPWAPTLLRVREDTVRAWIGPAMTLRLLRALRLRSISVVAALGRRRYEATHPPLRRMGMPIRILQLGGGVVAATGLLFTGRLPVPAGPDVNKATRWALRHRNELPRNYAEIVKYPPQYRSAIFAVSPPEVKAGLWIEALAVVRDDLPDATPAQLRILNEAIELTTPQTLFAAGIDGIEGDAIGRRLAGIAAAAQREFPNCRARRMLLNLANARNLAAIGSPADR